MTDNIKNTSEPKVSADPGLEGAPSEKNLQKEISKVIVKNVKTVFGGSKPKDGIDVKKKEVSKPAYEGQQTEKLFDPKNLLSDMTPKKTIKLVAGVLMVLVILAAFYVRFIRKDPIREETVVVTPPTPTYSPYQKYEPSIYATDPNFKSIEEAMFVLTQESTTTPLDESTLKPPKLDFNIEFKGIEVDE